MTAEYREMIVCRSGPMPSVSKTGLAIVETAHNGLGFEIPNQRNIEVQEVAVVPTGLFKVAAFKGPLSGGVTFRFRHGC